VGGFFHSTKQLQKNLQQKKRAIHKSELTSTIWFEPFLNRNFCISFDLNQSWIGNDASHLIWTIPESEMMHLIWFELFLNRKWCISFDLNHSWIGNDASHLIWTIPESELAQLTLFGRNSEKGIFQINLLLIKTDSKSTVNTIDTLSINKNDIKINRHSQNANLIFKCLIKNQKKSHFSESKKTFSR